MDRCMTLDNLGDSTQRSDRMEVLASADDDETGSIDFEEFLSVRTRKTFSPGSLAPTEFTL